MAQVLIDRLEEMVDVTPAKDLLAPLTSVCKPHCKSSLAHRAVQCALHSFVVACIVVLQLFVRARHDGSLLLVVEATPQQFHGELWLHLVHRALGIGAVGSITHVADALADAV